MERASQRSALDWFKDYDPFVEVAKVLAELREAIRETEAASVSK